MADTDLILVCGATGNTGSGVASSLCAQGRRVRALVRDEAKAAGLRAQGAQIAVADLDRPETLTDELLEGVTRVYFVTWNGPTALQQSRNLLETIKHSGKAPHIVRLSGYGTLNSRIISELGVSGAVFDPEQVTIAYDGIVVCAQGIAAPHDAEAVTKVMDQRELEITCDLHAGNGEATMLFTDLTHAYGDENMGTS